MIKKLIDIANKLDKLGYFSEAKEIDDIITNAGFLEWLSGKKGECNCKCENCTYARNIGGYGYAAKRRHCKNKNSGCKF